MSMTGFRFAWTVLNESNRLPHRSPQRFSRGGRSRREPPWRRPLVVEGLEDRTLPSFAAPLVFGPGVAPRAVAVADFNGDGRPDIVTAGSNSVSVLLGNGDGTFQTAVNYLVGRGPGGVAVGDFNGDGSLDLAVANFSSGDNSVLLNSGGGNSPGGRPGGSGKAGPGGFTAEDFLAGESPLSDGWRVTPAPTGPAVGPAPGRVQEGMEWAKADAVFTAAAALLRSRHSVEGFGDEGLVGFGADRWTGEGTFPFLVEE
jgi:hypothetical protein